MNTIVSPMLEPLIRHKIFYTQEDAIRELLRDYILRQIADLQHEIKSFTLKYGMNFHQFKEYLQERSNLLQSDKLSFQQRKILGQALMQEEDDWLDWKVTKEMLESWLGMEQEVIT